MQEKRTCSPTYCRSVLASLTVYYIGRENSGSTYDSLPCYPQACSGRCDD